MKASEKLSARNSGVSGGERRMYCREEMFPEVQEPGYQNKTSREGAAAAAAAANQDLGKKPDTSTSFPHSDQPCTCLLNRSPEDKG